MPTACAAGPSPCERARSASVPLYDSRIMCSWSSKTKRSFGRPPCAWAGAKSSSGLTSKKRPNTSFIARKLAAMPPLVARKRRRLMPRRFAAAPAISATRASTSRCSGVWPEGKYSPLETTCVGTGAPSLSASSARTRCESCVSLSQESSSREPGRRCDMVGLLSRGSLRSSHRRIQLLHRRHLAVQADVHARRGVGAVGLALGGIDKYRRAGFQLRAARRLEGHDARARRHEHLLLATLVLHGEHLAVAHVLDVAHVGVGHLALRPQVPVAMAFARAAHVLGEDVHLLGHERAVALTYRGGANELAARDVGDARLGDADHEHVVGHLDLHRLPAARLDRQHVALDALERAADTGRSVSRCLRERGGAGADERECRDCANHGTSVVGYVH